MTKWIKNYDQLAANKPRQDLLTIAEAGLTAIDTAAVIKNNIRVNGKTLTIQGQDFDLNKFKNIKVIGFGKVSCKAALALEEILGNLINSGIAIGIAPTACEIIQTHEGTHPQPSYQNVEISEQIMQASQDAKAEDLVLVVVSGGGSALLCWPKTECDQGQILYHQFLKTGGTIEELNTIRKHISLLKGGGLAKFLYPATVIGLIFSDVPGNHYNMIASGPTYKDATTVADARQIVKKYNLSEFEFTETIKDQKYFEKVTNIPLVSNIQALEAMRAAAKTLGYNPVILTNELYEEPDKALRQMQAELSQHDLVLAGGEPRMKVVAGGSGGRNLYTSMVALSGLKPDEYFLSLASDGLDNSNAAGAVADAAVLEKIKDKKLDLTDCTNRFDGYKLFENLGELIMTGPTEANVSDLLILLKK